MSTDDLTRRARAWATQPLLHEHYGAALVSELADEVDRLRAENERLASIEFIHAGCESIRRKDVQAVLDQRDAARAALERVRDVMEDGDRLDGLWIYAPNLDRDLEGEPS